MNNAPLLADLMTQEVFTLSPQALLSQAIELMVNHRISCVVIVDEDKPFGVVTERDIVKAVHHHCQATHFMINQTVSQVMSSPVISIHQAADMFAALVLTQTNDIRHLPVVDGRDHLVGLVTYTDLAHAYEHVVEVQRVAIEHAVQQKTAELKDVNEQLRALSMEDALMEIGNRRAMEVDLEFTHSTAVRYSRQYAVVLCDVDYFKKYNDQYGHSAGDQALKQVAGLIKQQIRRSDRVYRYGGEELLILLPETDLQGADILSQRLVQSVYDLKIVHQQSPLDTLTVSAGVAVNSSSWMTTVEAADKALYEAKAAGRNQSRCTRLGVKPHAHAGATMH